jgi:AraC-like DNA-binding protein
MMSSMRQDEPLARGYAVTHPPGTVVLPQPPGWHQLLLATSGVLTVETAQGSWVVPPGRAVWVPDGMGHRLVMTGRVRVRALYLAAAAAETAGALAGVGCRAVNVPPVLRELVDLTVRRAPLYPDRPADARLVGVVVDLLEELPAAPLRLPLPRDRRALDVAAALRADPASEATVAELAAQAGAARRTIERLFRAETGMSVGTWRQRLRLVEALRLLAAGEPVSRVAPAVGYSTPSAFGAMFVRHMGTTPGRYFGAPNAHGLGSNAHA